MHSNINPPPYSKFIFPNSKPFVSGLSLTLLKLFPNNVKVLSSTCLGIGGAEAGLFEGVLRVHG